MSELRVASHPSHFFIPTPLRTSELMSL
jgi:hypothetical protein